MPAMDSAVVTVKQGKLFAAFLRLHGITIEGLRKEIGHENIARGTLDNLVRGKVDPYGRTVRYVTTALNRLVPRRRLSAAALRYLVKHDAPSTPEAQLAAIDKAVALRDPMPEAG